MDIIENCETLNSLVSFKSHFESPYSFLVLKLILKRMSRSLP